MGVQKLTDDVVEQILEHLRDGLTLIEACEKHDLTARALRKRRTNDEKLNEVVFQARLDGILLQLDEAEIALKTAEKRDDILKAKELCAHVRWKCEKLLEKFQPVQKSEVEHTGPFVIGWQPSQESTKAKPDDAAPDIGTVGASGGEARRSH